MKAEYFPPKKLAKAFNCPNCHVYAKQSWYYMGGATKEDGFGTQYHNEKFLVSDCENCSSPTIWLGDTIVFPIHSSAQDFATRWLWTYNNERLNMGIGGITPKQKLALAT